MMTSDELYEAIKSWVADGTLSFNQLNMLAGLAYAKEAADDARTSDE